MTREESMKIEKLVRELQGATSAKAIADRKELEVSTRLADAMQSAVDRRGDTAGVFCDGCGTLSGPTDPNYQEIALSDTTVRVVCTGCFNRIMGILNNAGWRPGAAS